MSLAGLLTATNEAQYTTQKAAAKAELELIFPADDWDLQFDVDAFSASGKANLWQRGLTSPIRGHLADQGKTSADYARFLGDVHTIAATATLKRFWGTKTVTASAGWRVSMLSLTAAGVVVVGVESNYTGTTSQNKHAVASGVMRELALAGLATANPPLAFPGKSVSSQDWEYYGLLAKPNCIVDGIDVCTVEAKGLPMRAVRTTTAKKTISTFLDVSAFPFASLTKGAVAPSTVCPALTDTLEQLRDAMEHLADNIYPFRDPAEFDKFRAVALTNPAAAQARVRIGSNSAKKAVMNIYYGPPGTGKTLEAVKRAVQLADPEFADFGDIPEVFRRFHDLHEQTALVTFHQSLRYSDVVESIRPVIRSARPHGLAAGDSADELVDDEAADDGAEDGVTVEDEELLESNAGDPDGPGFSDADEEARGARRQLAMQDDLITDIGYFVYEGPILQLMKKALTNEDKDYVLVIDEINRGDASQIFGPLISVLDSDKRVGSKFPIGFERQYPSPDEFESRSYMPANLHVLGTMNSSDRNIALLDHALRRRFDFVEVPPQPALLERADKMAIDPAALLTALNERIEYLIDRDHCIGHGYLMDCSTDPDVIEAFARKILPLLQEYFYGDDSKLLLVLGDRLGGETNVFEVKRVEARFEQLFGMSPEEASEVGYRQNRSGLTISLDQRFWNPNLATPGPGEPDYAVKALKKIYSPGGDSKAGLEGGEPEPDQP